MRYFIEDVRLYKPINKKWQDVQKFVIPIMQYLVADEPSLEKLEKNIVNHIEQLNRYYSRSRPLVLTVSRNLTGCIWRIGTQDDYDKIAALIYIRVVRGDIHFSLQDGESIEFSPTTDGKSSANRVGSQRKPTR